MTISLVFALKKISFLVSNPHEKAKRGEFDCGKLLEFSIVEEGKKEKRGDR